LNNHQLILYFLPLSLSLSLCLLIKIKREGYVVYKCAFGGLFRASVIYSRKKKERKKRKFMVRISVSNIRKKKQKIYFFTGIFFEKFSLKRKIERKKK